LNSCDDVKHLLTTVKPKGDFVAVTEATHNVLAKDLRGKV